MTLPVRRDDANGTTGGGRVWLEVRDAHAVATSLGDVPGCGEPFRVAIGWTVEVADSWGDVVGVGRARSVTHHPARFGAGGRLWRPSAR